MLKCCDFLADQHETLSQMLLNEVVEPMKNLQKVQATTSSQLMADIAKQNAIHDKERKSLIEVCSSQRLINMQALTLEQVQKKCDKAEREAELARLAYDKVKNVIGSDCFS